MLSEHRIEESLNSEERKIISELAQKNLQEQMRYSPVIAAPLTIETAWRYGGRSNKPHPLAEGAD